MSMIRETKVNGVRSYNLFSFPAALPTKLSRPNDFMFQSRFINQTYLLSIPVCVMAVAS